MYENNLFIKYGIIYNTENGCSKQYRCENTMCILSALVFTYIVIIDRCINVPGHGRSKIDDMNGSDRDIIRKKRA